MDERALLKSNSGKSITRMADRQNEMTIVSFGVPRRNYGHGKSIDTGAYIKLVWFKDHNN
jgi:hypothetical protein